MTRLGNARRRRRPGRWLISAIALAAPAGAFAADWNETHVFNPAWPPHAKFHNAQTMLTALGLGLSSVWALWRPQSRRQEPRQVQRGTALAAAYWLTQLGAIAFPGTALRDDPGPRSPRWNQITAQLLVIWPVLGLGYALERKRA